tara:strand:- start:345 stop:614 length:270 start_codon:yes stop_codon:yes gene_type:complete
MRYIINFQVKIKNDGVSNEPIRSSYTVSEKDSEKYNLLNIIKVEDWFNKFFKQTPLDHFIDTKELSKTTNFDMKIGRITNAISGEYKTF